MNELPILQKNAYLTVAIKDNHIFANLAYADFVAGRTYILSDITDLAPLKFRMDDIVFNSKFWGEYFEALEHEFEWEIVNRGWEGSFRFLEFEKEGIGVNGIKVLVDDTQPFFTNIFNSLKEFSKDIVVRVVDDNFTKSLMEGLVERLGYDDLLWIDLDLSHFSVFRYRSDTITKGVFNKSQDIVKNFTSSKINWNNEIGLVDSIRNSKLQAFIAAETSSEELLNKWANFVAYSVDNISDVLIEDVLRSFTTIQLLSIKSDNKDKIEAFGTKADKSAILVTGKIPRLLPKKLLALSIIDGLELDGSFDMFVDINNTVISYGRNMIDASNSREILVLKNDVLPVASKVLIPELRSGNAKNKVIYSARVISQDFEQKEIYAINPNFEIFPIPYVSNKVLVEGVFKNSALLNQGRESTFDFISSTASVLYDSLIVDARFRPVVYGPRNIDNKVKLQMWLNGNKE